MSLPVDVGNGSLTDQVQNVMAAISRGELSTEDAARLVATVTTAAEIVEREKLMFGGLGALLAVK